MLFLGFHDRIIRQYTNPNLTIQEKLKDLRVAKGLTTEQLSKATWISKSALDYYGWSDDEPVPQPDGDILYHVALSADEELPFQ